MHHCGYMHRTGDAVRKLVLSLLSVGPRERARRGRSGSLFLGVECLGPFLKLVIFLTTMPPDLCIGVTAQDVCAFEAFSARASWNVPTVNCEVVSQPRLEATCKLLHPMLSVWKPTLCKL